VLHRSEVCFIQDVLFVFL